MKYDPFSKLNKYLEDFASNKVTIVESSTPGRARYASKNEGGVVFSQKETLNRIDLYINSEFESGKYDSEGQRKVFLNIVRFIRDVSRMRTDIDVKNYVFNPETYDDFWKTYTMQRQFKLWARKTYFGELLNRIGDDYATYGTAVVKRVGNMLYRVPLGNLINTQDAKTLKDAVLNGGYVIERHRMKLAEMKRMKGWDMGDLDDYDKEYLVYEMYAMCENDKGDYVPMVHIIIPADSGKKGEKGHILFEGETDPPYEEVFWEKIDNRWLGRGPVEVQLENQLARNMTANMRRRGLLWSSKKIFQTQSEEVQKNLVKDVKDGEVLYVGKTTGITPVPMETRNVGEYSSDEEVWKENSQQQSFTFEVATGEALPSGTPFRLGVVLSQAVDTFFNIKREQLGLFCKRSFFELMIPIFKKEAKEFTLAIARTDDGFELVRKAMIDEKTERKAIQVLLNGEIPDKEAIRAQVEKIINESPNLFLEGEEGLYDDVKYYLELDITDEANDTQTDITTLTTLWQAMNAKGDPRADRVLEFIFAKTGKNLSSIVGNAPPPQLPQGQPGQAGANLANNLKPDAQSPTNPALTTVPTAG